MKGRVEKYLLDKIEEYGGIHLSLLDPHKTPIKNLSDIIKDIEKAGSTGVMVGGSTISEQLVLDKFVTNIKRLTDLPVILFPNNITGLSPKADAIWFMSLFNSRNPYYITGAQMLAAPAVKKMRLEPLPLIYLIIGKEKGAVGFIGDANPIPCNKPDIAASYVLAASFLGIRFAYLEAGSGVKTAIPKEFVSYVHQVVPNITLIIGGGIKEAETAYQLIHAGADIIVTGTLIENEKERLAKTSNIINAIKQGASRKGVRK